MSGRIRPQKLNFKARSPFLAKDDFIKPQIWDRINENISLGKINTIAIEGASQTGKSTLGSWICEHYDPEYVTWWNTEDVFKCMDDLKQKAMSYMDKNPHLPIIDAVKPIQHKWFLFEEPDSFVSRAKWRSEHTQAIIRIINMYGFLKPNLVLCMPDMDELGSGFFRNLTYRVFITVRKRFGRIVRKATFYRPYKPVGLPKYKWYPIGETEIPELTLTNDYFKRKMHNFFDDKLNLYKNLITVEDAKLKKYYNPIPEPISPERKKEIEKFMDMA